MCRFTVFKGKGSANAILLSNLILKPHHSIIKQSYACTMRVTDFMANLNGDGFGVGWYDTHEGAHDDSSATTATTTNTTASSAPLSLSAAAAAADRNHHSHVVGDERHPGRDVLPNRIDVAGECDVDDDDDPVDVGDGGVAEDEDPLAPGSNNSSGRMRKTKSHHHHHHHHQHHHGHRHRKRARTTDVDLNACESVVLRKRADPCVFTSITPAWNNINLRRLSDKIRSSTIFAHVRAATPGLITSQTNCHPFQYKQFMFMHNGAVAHWETIKRSLLFSLREKFFAAIQGSTDSELCFFLILNEIESILEAAQLSAMTAAEVYKAAIGNVIRRLVVDIEAATAAASHPVNEVTMLNFCFTDGDICCCTKFVHPVDRTPASLYFTSGTEFTDQNHGGQFRMIQQDKRQLCHIVSSEPLTADVDDWISVPTNTLITINEKSNLTIDPIELSHK